ncbi:MAG: YggS family pyridoxal phosphate-dependent enzyme [Parachlamydiaceae bacterium]|nr:YggS family pyridoxal phosphate-dependent enzyme [Parachlamydiaceae bacterium]
MTHYFEILENVRRLSKRCGRDPGSIKLLAVSKNRDIDQIQQVFNEGCLDFGESRWQEAKEKILFLPENIQWHFIGTLQSNKVNPVISNFSLIHSVDHFSLLKKISQVSHEKQINTSVLLQVNTSGELTKHGLKPEEWENFLDEVNDLPNIQIKGLMTMAPMTKDETIIRLCFRRLYDLRENWKNRMRDPLIFNELSMGMSNDYGIAIEEGATILRIGSAIFETHHA